jgi:hypothetical protein
MSRVQRTLDTLIIVEDASMAATEPKRRGERRGLATDGIDDRAIGGDPRRNRSTDQSEQERE